MDTKLIKSTQFHPQTKNQTKVLNKKIIHLLLGYCNQHPKLWNEQLQYIHNTYNKEKHSSTQKSPFGTSFGYFPPSPIDVYMDRESNTHGEY